jgi:hypothetical protein
MQGVETTHFCVVINKSVDELLLSIWNDTVTVVGYQSKKSCLLDFLQLFGNINNEIGQGLHFLLGVFEIFHILHYIGYTK